MLASLNPILPVYCVHPARLAEAAREFLSGFPGRTLYAVKANNDPTVIDALYDAGIREFDCASLAEIDLVASRYTDAKCYFMSPVRLPGDAESAYGRHGVRHFMVDSLEAIADLVAEVPAQECVIFARMAVSHASAVENLSSKFGAAPESISKILDQIRSFGGEPALAFNVGSGVRSPDGYRYALDVAASVLSQLSAPVRLVDIGGGFPRSYPGFDVPPLADFFAAVRGGLRNLPLAENAELLAEPGRALCATGMSTVVRVLLRKEDSIYINDGMYGAFWELRFDGHKRHPARAFRDGARLDGPEKPFTVFGPTCDSTDRLPEAVALPASIRAGDHVEFGLTGAYSLSGRTSFNGFYSSQVVTIASTDG